MNNDIKEINIPENVLVALGDLTNGALNYYKAKETIKVRHNTILDHITNLQEENKKLHKELDYADNYNIYLIAKIGKALEELKGYAPNEYVLCDIIDNTISILEGDDK